MNFSFPVSSSLVLGLQAFTTTPSLSSTEDQGSKPCMFNWVHQQPLFLFLSIFKSSTLECPLWSATVLQRHYYYGHTVSLASTRWTPGPKHWLCFKLMGQSGKSCKLTDNLPTYTIKKSNSPLCQSGKSVDMSSTHTVYIESSRTARTTEDNCLKTKQQKSQQKQTQT